MADNAFWTGSDFWIGDLPLNYIDDNGCRWMVHDVDGWWELPPPELPDDSRPYSDDGDYYVSGRYAPRIITISGRVLPPASGGSRAAVTDARDRLNNTLNSVRRTFVFKVDEPGYSKQADVQIASKPEMTINDYKNHLEFSIQMKASDPRKYSSELHSIANTLFLGTKEGRMYPRAMYYRFNNPNGDNILNVINDGNYPTYGVIRLSGPITSPKLHHTEQNKFIQINDVLGIGEFVDINLRNRTVKMNGKQFKRSSITTTSSWFNLAPGENTLVFTGNQHIPPVEGKQYAVNQAINPSFESARTNSSNIIRTNLFHTPEPTSTQNMKLTSNNGQITNYGTASSNPTGGSVLRTVTRFTINPRNESYDFKINLHNGSLPVKKSTKYSYSFYIKSDTEVTVQPALYWSSTEPDWDPGGAVLLKPGEWQRVTMESESGPTDVHVTPSFLVWKGDDTEYFHLWGAQLEESPHVTPYFSGASTAPNKYRWAGEAYNSVSYEYGDKYNLTIYGSETVPFNSVAWKQARNTVDDSDNAGHVVGVSTQTGGHIENTSFIVPSSETGSGNNIIDVGSQGLESGKTYTAMAEIIVPEAMRGVYDEVSTINYSTNPTPLEDFSTNWKASREEDSLEFVSVDGANGDHVRIYVDDWETPINGTGIEYSQDAGEIPANSVITVSGMVKSNRQYPVQPVVRWYNGNTLMRETKGEIVQTTLDNQWVSAPVQTNTPYAFTRMTFTAQIVNINQASMWSRYDFFDMKSILIIEGEDETGFFDGNTPDSDTETYIWNNLVGRSTSTKLTLEGGEDSLHEYARSLVFFTMDGPSISEINTESVVMDQAPNAPGEYQLKIEFTTPDDSFFTPMFVSLWNGSPASSDLVYFDNFMIVEGSYEGKYFDGGSADASWNGTAHHSTSTQSEVEEVPEAEALIQYRSAWIS